MLDTVFVVRSGTPYRNQAELRELLPQDATIRECVGDCVSEFCNGQTLYEGEMFSDNDGEAPFCWVPALPVQTSDSDADRFARPFISQVLGEGLSRGSRDPGTRLTVPAGVAWRKVANFTQNIGLGIAVELRTP